MILFQTNLYSFIKKIEIKCYSEFSMINNTDTLIINAHALNILDVYVIQNGIKHKAEFNFILPKESIDASRESFNSNLYQELKEKTANMRIYLPKEINREEKHTMRIIYTPDKQNTFINHFSVSDTVTEVFCFSFFPYFEDSKHDIESIFVYADNLTLFAPGKITKKNKKENIQFTSHLTRQIRHIPFVLGLFKCIDCSQNMIKCKIYMPLEFSLEPELKQDICLILQYLQDNYFKKAENIGIIFSYNNIHTVSQNTIFIPMSLFPMNGIDQNIFLRTKICELFSKMLFCNLSCGDFWLAVSVREYMKHVLMREILGENEIHYINKMDLEFVYKNDVYESSLINEPDKTNRDNSFVFYGVKLTKSYYFKMIKGRVFLQVLENHLSRAFLERIMHNTWEKNETNTIDFLKTIKDVSGKDMTSFFDYYVYRPGIIECYITFEMDKKGRVDIYMKQKSTSKKINANKRILQDLKLKVFEQEGVFDHKVVNDTLSFQCHYRTKKRKTEKETKPVQKNDSVNGDGTETEDKPTTKENIEGNINTGQVIFLRGDPCNEQIVKIIVEQPDYMFTEQLITEKNVYSQIDAVLALRYKASEDSIQTLERVLNDSHVFYKVRLMILYVISQIEIKNTLHDSYRGSDTVDEKNYNLGFQRIIQYFVKKNCVPGSTIPKSNDFSSFTAYLVQKYLSNALAVSDPELSKKFNDRVLISKNITIAFLLNIIKYNSYDDGFLYNSPVHEVFNQNFIANTNYLSCIIDSLSFQICSKSSIDLSPIIYEFERRRISDITFPSYQNLITSSILKSSGRMCFYGTVDLNYNLVKELSKQGNFYSVREEAINVLCTCFLDKAFDFIIEMFWTAERYFKIFILHTIKSIFEILDEDCSDQEEYARVFDDLEISNGDAKIRFMNHSRFKCLYEKKDTFFNILASYHYDSIIMEAVTDILYLMSDKIMKCSLDEKIVQIERPTFVIQLVVNNVVLLHFPEKMRKEGTEKKCEEIKIATNVQEKSPFIIRFSRHDIVELHYDDFIHKYFLCIQEYNNSTKQNINASTIIKESIIEMKDNSNLIYETSLIKDNNKVSESNYTINDIDQIRQPNINDNNTEIKCNNTINDIKSVKLNPMASSAIKNNASKLWDINNRSLNVRGCDFSYRKKDNPIFNMLCRMAKYTVDLNSYESFVMFTITKYLKRHKYTTRLGIDINKESNLNAYQIKLHNQFTFYYSSQKHGSQYYLNAKALQNYFEQTLHETMLFEPTIAIDDRVHGLCVELLDDICRIKGSFNFSEPVDYPRLKLINYIDIVRIPIDLGTIRLQLNSRMYFSVEYFIKNIELVFLNCMAFNENDSQLYTIARNVLAKTRSLILTKFIPSLLGYNPPVSFKFPLDFTGYFLFDQSSVYGAIKNLKEIRTTYNKITNILIDVRGKREASQFIHHLFDPKKMVKKQISLNDMIFKAQQNSYISIGHIISDMNNLIKNVVTLNGSTSWVVRICRKMENHFRRELFTSFGLRYIGGRKE